MHDGEWRRLHPASIIIVALQQAKSLFLAIGAVVITSLTRRNSSRGFDILEIGLAILGVLAIIPAVFHYLTVKYRIADRAFTLKSGVLFRQTRTIPLERIQNVVTKRTLIQRLLGVSTLQIE